MPKRVTLKNFTDVTKPIIFLDTGIKAFLIKLSRVEADFILKRVDISHYLFMFTKIIIKGVQGSFLIGRSLNITFTKRKYTK